MQWRGRALADPPSPGEGIERTFSGSPLSETAIRSGEQSPFQSRLQDNGEQGFNLTADTNVQENMTFTFQGSHKVTFDKNLNRRFAQTVFSVVLQMQLSGR